MSFIFFKAALHIYNCHYSPKLAILSDLLWNVCLCFPRFFCQIRCFYVQCHIYVEALHSNKWALEGKKTVKFNFDLQKPISNFPFFDSNFDKIYSSALLSFVSPTIVIENLTLSFREVLLSGTVCTPGTPASVLDFFFLPSAWDKFWKSSDLLLRSGTYQLSCSWEVFLWQQ